MCAILDTTRGQLEEQGERTKRRCQHGYEEKIRRLELEARPLDPGPKERALLRDKVVAYADSLEHMDGKLAFAVSQGEDGALYDSPISESTDPDEA